MKKLIVIAGFLAFIGVSAAAAAEYQAAAQGPFITITQEGDLYKNKAISLRKSSVISAQLDGVKVILMTSGLETVLEQKDARRTTYERPVAYTFEHDTENDAKKFFDFIMNELGS